MVSACAFYLAAFQPEWMKTGSGAGRALFFVRYFRGYNSTTGELMWQDKATAGVNAPPTSYNVAGKQYIVVAAGGNVQLNFKRGNEIIAYKLGKK